jgi:hypothetical protein
MPKYSHHPKTLSPTNVDAFLSEGWATKLHPICVVMPGQKNNIIGFDDYYFLHEHVLCTRAFSTSAVTSTIDDGAFPPGSTELDDETGHNCQMPCTLYPVFCALVLGLSSKSWTNTRSEAAFRNMLLQDLDAILHYYAVSYSIPTGNHGINEPILLPGDQADMAKSLQSS